MIHKLWSERDTAPQFGKKAVAATWWQEMKTWTCLETRSVAHPDWRSMRRTTGDHRTSTLLSQVWRAVSDLMQMVFLMHRLDSGCADFILRTAAAHQASDWTVREEIHWPLIIRHDGKILSFSIQLAGGLTWGEIWGKFQVYINIWKVWVTWAIKIWIKLLIRLLRFTRRNVDCVKKLTAEIIQHDVQTDEHVLP